MGKNEKLLKRLLSQPNDFTYTELKKLMNSFGFEEDNKGKSSGSRVAFYHSEKQLILQLHKPHSNNRLKAYQIKEIITFLKGTGAI
jgi:hypothetical protein